MKIVLTGGGSGGHFYPILAVADSIRTIAKKEHLVEPRLWFVSSEPYPEGLLYEHGLTGTVIPTGKRRIYTSIQNIFDIFKTAIAFIKALFFLFRIFPDVVFGKGGYATFPLLLAARFFGIPIIIHESDTVPGRVNIWAGKFALRVAVSYPEAAAFFPKDKVAWTGNPIRQSLFATNEHDTPPALSLETGVPVVLILGGSLGAKKINDTILDTLQTLLPQCYIIHQTGKDHFEEVKKLAHVSLETNPHEKRYYPLPYIDDHTLRFLSQKASLIITRAGSTLFEIAAWGIPSIVVPITESNGDHQRQNAYTYARTGAAVVIEESNFTPHVLSTEITRLLQDKVTTHRMREATKSFARLDAADLIAKELIGICLKHER